MSPICVLHWHTLLNLCSLNVIKPSIALNYIYIILGAHGSLLMLGQTLSTISSCSTVKESSPSLNLVKCGEGLFLFVQRHNYCVAACTVWLKCMQLTHNIIIITLPQVQLVTSLRLTYIDLCIESTLITLSNVRCDA